MDINQGPQGYHLVNRRKALARAALSVRSCDNGGSPRAACYLLPRSSSLHRQIQSAEFTCPAMRSYVQV